MAMALALVPCSTDELSNGNATSSSKQGVQLVLSTGDFDQISSRGVVSDNVIVDVNILEYQNGSRIAGKYLSAAQDKSLDFTKAVEVKDLKDLPATTLKDGVDANGNTVQVMDESQRQNFVFVIANAGKDLTTDESLGTFSGLQKYTMAFSGKRAGDNTKYINVPMTGFYYGGISTSTASQMNVTLQRAVAKINFNVNTNNFKVNGETPSQILINSISLCNVPTNITLYPCQNRPTLPSGSKAGVWQSVQVPFPTSAEMQSSTTYTADDNQSSTANNFVAYIPENVRGSFDDKITSNLLKTPATIGADDKSCTYVNVDLSYTFTNGAEGHAIYKIYLGGNDLGDMNLLRNTQYNVTTNLYGANRQDTRITVQDAFNPGTVANSQPAANCYMVNMSNAAKTLTIPLGQARRGWAWIANKTNKTTDFDAFKTALASGNFTVEQIWTTATGTITGKLNANKNYIDVTIPATVKNGNNAVIALRSTTDKKIYWSWHLWFTDYDPAKNNVRFAGVAFQPGGRYANKAMMDRNLGATITGVAKITDQPKSDWGKYYGMFYQYGRKDPFLPADGTSIGSKNTQITVNGTATSCQLTTTTLANAVQYPTVFYVGGAEWNNDVPAYTDFWSANGVKSAFDPCPQGWRVPTGGDNADYNPWAGFCDGIWNTTTNMSVDESVTPFKWKGQVNNAAGNVTNAVSSGRLYSYGGVSSWYPASGNRESSSDAINSVGSGGYYWSASGRSLRFFSPHDVNPAYSNNRSCGFPVRCIQE